MSENDDELRRLTESPEDRIRRTHLEEIGELRQQEFRRKHRWAIRIGSTALVLVTFSGAGYGMNRAASALDASSRAETQKIISDPDNALEPALTSVEGLRKHGACAIALRAEADLASARVKIVDQNDTWRKRDQGIASRFKRAARLAEENNVSCVPSETGASSLTPAFDIESLKRNRICADELDAKKTDVDQASNSYAKRQIEIVNKALDIDAGIARQLNISCD